MPEARYYCISIRVKVRESTRAWRQAAQLQAKGVPPFACPAAAARQPPRFCAQACRRSRQASKAIWLLMPCERQARSRLALKLCRSPAFSAGLRKSAVISLRRRLARRQAGNHARPRLYPRTHRSCRTRSESFPRFFHRAACRVSQRRWRSARAGR